MSGKLVETDVDISSIAADAVTGTGVPNEADLVGWAEAVLARDVPATERHRSRLVEDLGVDAANDAAGVIATFNMVTRMADAAGIPVDPGFEQFMGSTVEDAGIAHLRHN